METITSDLQKHTSASKKQVFSKFHFLILAAVVTLSVYIVFQSNGLAQYLPTSLSSEIGALEQQLPLSALPTAIASNTFASNDCNTLTQSCPVKRKKARKAHKPLNILLLYADDWRHDSIGSASGGAVKTPFLDSMAQEGIRFTHNCVTTAICWISRATLYMGQWMSRHNTTLIRRPYFFQHWNTSFVRLLQTQGGYYVGHVGKFHFYYYDQIEGLWNFSRQYYGQHWLHRKQRNGGPIHVTKRNEEDALEFLKLRPKDQPFFLGVCFFAPHSVDNKKEQYFPQPTSMEWYANDTINRSVSATEEAWKLLPGFFTDRNEGRVRWRWRFDSEQKYQDMMKNYYRLISEVDETSGKIVQALKDEGILNETLVIFTTDNGLFHSEHGLAGKWYPHQESIRVPLIINDPRIDQSRLGTTIDDFTLSVDLASTILGAANLAPSPRMQGRDIAELYLEDVDDWRQEFFYEHPTHNSPSQIPGSTALVRKDWKYMRWPDFETEQLFDLKNDPYELNDLIEAYNESVLLAEMRRRHDELKVLAM